MKKILSFICVITLCFLSFGSYKPKNAFISASAYNQTYNYTAQVESAYNSIDSYAIDSVESFTHNDTAVVKISINTGGSDRFLCSFINNANLGNVFGQSYMIYNNPSGVSVCMIGSLYFSSYSTGLYVYSGKNNNVDIYLAAAEFLTPVNGQPVIVNTNDLNLSLPYDSLVDMNSETETPLRSFSRYSYNSSNNYDYSILNSAFAYVFNDPNRSNYTSSSGTMRTVFFPSYNLSAYLTELNFSTFQSIALSSTKVNNNNGFNLYYYADSFVIEVYRPVYRVNNTLILYNYDYLSMASHINYVSYSLSRSNDLYVVSYSGSVPNSYFSYFYNSDIQNTLFDAYIEVTFDFDNSLVEPIYNVETGNYYVNLGFDFNFSYYAQPLNSSNGIYSYTFDKPSYVAMEFSLYPFYIPILEMVENALIFLLFYCPIISDILELLHMSEFLGGLITVINYYTTGVLGTFITALISFFIFYLFFKSILPTVSSGVGSMVDNSYIGYSSKRNKEERYNKKRNRKELRHQYKLIDKEYKKRESNKKKGIPD